LLKRIFFVPLEQIISMLLTMLTTQGPKEGSHAGIVQCEIILSDLFD